MPQASNPKATPKKQADPSNAKALAQPRHKPKDHITPQRAAPAKASSASEMSEALKPSPERKKTPSRTSNEAASKSEQTSPAAHPKPPAAHPKPPAAHPKPPATHPKPPATHPKSPATHPKSPAAHPKPPTEHPTPARLRVHSTDAPETIQDPPRFAKATKASAKRSFLTTPQRWSRLDRWLTALACCSVLGLIGVVYGVNHWARSQGAQKLHPLSVHQFSDRLFAFFSYVEWTWGPPKGSSASLGYEKEIVAAALHARLAPHLLKAMIQKNSSFQPHLVSADGAIGLMQVTPTMARVMKHKGSLFLPSSNLRAGAGYLRVLLAQAPLPEALRHYRQASCPSCSQRSLVVRRGYVEHILDISRRFARDPGQQIRRQVRANRHLRTQQIAEHSE
ncbi:lytic transglycosylase domain-containing protein [Myxococcota bacterium]|nr:lytic transglycosylase domain-containing protein [Myxococcota bacterium]